MSDALDRLAGVGHDLFRRVGDVLRAGGLDGGSLLTLVRRVGGLPEDALDFALGLDPRALREAGAELRAVGGRFGGLPERISADVGSGGWAGGGAEAFGVVWEALGGYIGGAGEPESIAGRMRVTGDYLDALAEWAGTVRGEMAEAIARVAGSGEAVTVLIGTLEGAAEDGGTAVIDRRVVAAAGRIAERVLLTAADAIEAADRLVERFGPALSELAYEPPRVPSGPAVIEGVTRVRL